MISVAPITLDALGAGIPIGDDAICIQHVNGVVGHPPDKQSEASLALAEPGQRLGQLPGAFLNALLEDFIEAVAGFVDLFGGGKINQHIYRTDQAPRTIVERRRIGHKRDACAIGPLGDRLTAADRAVFIQGPGHRALATRHRPAIRPVEAPGHAPLVIADFGRTTRELYRRLIVGGNYPGGVGRVDRRRQRVEQFAKV